jgi:hypothetical protein
MSVSDAGRKVPDFFGTPPVIRHQPGAVVLAESLERQSTASRACLKPAALLKGISGSSHRA